MLKRFIFNSLHKDKSKLEFKGLSASKLISFIFTSSIRCLSRLFSSAISFAKFNLDIQFLLPKLIFPLKSNSIKS